MNKKLTIGFIIGVFAVSVPSMAQDPAFSQFYANPIYLNPALAGSAQCPRIVLNYRNQWPGIPATYVTYSASYDQYVDGVRGGIGLQAYHDRAGSGIINTTSFSGMYAYQLPVTRTMTVKASLQASYYNRSIDWDQLTFGDQIHKRYGFIYQTQENPIQENVNKPDLTAGFLAFSKTLYAGFAAHHLTQPNESFFPNSESRLPRKYTAHAGALIPMDKNDEGIGSFSPNFIYQYQGGFNQFNMGLYVNRGPVTGGVWYRWKDALIFLVGLYTDAFRFGYSYDVTVSRLGTQTWGSHEISVTMMMPCKPKRTKFRQVQCPKF